VEAFAQQRKGGIEQEETEKQEKKENEEKKSDGNVWAFTMFGTDRHLCFTFGIVMFLSSR